MDDNPAERAIVRRFLPEVAVPDMPEDPAGYIQALALHRYFETVSFTREDAAAHATMPRTPSARSWPPRATDVDSFLASLQMRMKVSPVTDLNVERATQLVNKSNQFNLTTRRYTLAQVREMAASPDWRTLTFSLADTLGDNGLISVLFLRKQGETLSDRHLGDELPGAAPRRGTIRPQRIGRHHPSSRLHAGSWAPYIPTAKNGMVKDHYARLGFEPAGADGDQTFWSLEIEKDLEPLPHHIQRDISMSDVRDRVQGIFRQVFGDSRHRPARRHDGGDVDGWDSLAHINLIIAVEKGHGHQVRHGRNLKDEGTGPERRHVHPTDREARSARK